MNCLDVQYLFNTVPVTGMNQNADAGTSTGVKGSSPVLNWDADAGGVSLLAGAQL
jgi:hypothetical protein